MTTKTIVIVGTGEAAKMAAKSAHEVSHDLRVVHFDRENSETLSLDMDARVLVVNSKKKNKARPL